MKRKLLSRDTTPPKKAKESLTGSGHHEIISQFLNYKSPSSRLPAIPEADSQEQILETPPT
jgi:hypothetical protein